VRLWMGHLVRLSMRYLMRLWMGHLVRLCMRHLVRLCSIVVNSLWLRATGPRLLLLRHTGGSIGATSW
jgi:hypothetical protein